MDSRIPPGSFFQYSPTGLNGSLQRSSSPTDRERYLSELLAERQKLAPFMQVMPVCSRLLSQEILRTSGFVSNQSFMDHERMGPERPYRPLGQQPNGGPMDVETWSSMQSEENGLLRRMAPVQPSAMGWPAAALGLTTTPVVKRVIRLDVPLDKFPNVSVGFFPSHSLSFVQSCSLVYFHFSVIISNSKAWQFNFVGRILGPRGNSLKRIEAMTECRIFIRGRGSVKDSMKEEKLKDKLGYEHLNEPLHLLVEAEFPEDMIDSRLEHAVALLENLLKPVDESMDVYKKQQLRELAMLNGTLREESPSMSPSMSPFNNGGMKRAKTGR